MKTTKNIVSKICSDAKKTCLDLAGASTDQKNNFLYNLAQLVKKNKKTLFSANKKDISLAKKNGHNSAFLDRLEINEKTILSMSDGLTQIAQLPDPVGEFINIQKQSSGISVGMMRVPIGVVGIIYESRPNVTIDASCLSLKSNNSLILRGGSDSFHTSFELVKIVTDSFNKAGLPKNIIQMIPTTKREAVDHLLSMNNCVNVIIPRGGKSLIKKINEKSKIPVIKHLEGLCHIFVDKEANIELAKKVIFNSKLRRPEICGATETLLIDSEIKEKAYQLLLPLHEAGCEIKGDEFIQTLDKNFNSATEEDWSIEYLDKIISVKIVNGVKGAIEHINKYSSNHTESIITENEQKFIEFYNNIDSAIILKNASTQYADGGEFGFGAEIGISTDKLHVRGPVGAKHLTTFKYVVHGSGQIRP